MTAVGRFTLTPQVPTAVTQVIYSSGTSSKTHNTGTISVLPGAVYTVQLEVLRNDLQSSSERVVDVTLDGRSIGGCNPDGGDYDCTFFNCPIPATTVQSQTGTIQVSMQYTGHSWDCDCDTSTW